MTRLATLVFIVGILGLFVLDRNPKVRTSAALWLPVIWVFIAGSRAVVQWLGMAPATASADDYLEGSPIDRNVLTVLMVFALIVLLKRGREAGKLLRANAPLVLFFLYCAISTVWSPYPDVAFKRWFKALGDLMMILVVMTDPEWLTAVKRLLSRTGFFLLPLSILFIKYYPALGRGYTKWEFQPVYTGVATDKNMLGMVCLTIGLGSVWRFLQARRSEENTRKGQLIAHGTILAMAVWLLWRADSATSIACFFMGAGLMVMTSMPALARKKSLVHLYMMGMVFVSLFALFLDSGGTLVGALGRNPTLTGRTDIWKMVLQFTASPLRGTGFESFWLGDRLKQMWAIDPQFNHIQEAHNGYLEVYLNLGWIGLVLLLIVLMTSYRKILAAFHQDPDAGRLPLVYFATAVVYSFTEAGFRMRSPIWIFLLLAILAPKPSAKGLEATSLPQGRADLSPAKAPLYQGVVPARTMNY